MTTKASNIRWSAHYLLLPLAALGLSESALAACVNSLDQNDMPQDATVVALDGVSGCSAISGQYGCSIKNPALHSFCDYVGTDSQGGPVGFRATVVGVNDPSYALRWEIGPVSGNPAGENYPLPRADTGVVGGGSQGKNNCAAFYNYDVTTGSGGDCKTFGTGGNCLEWQNVTRLDVCTDLVDEIPPPPQPVAQGLPACNSNPDPNDTDVDGLLDQTGVKCPTDGSPAIVCNLEKDKVDWGASDGSPVCCSCNIDKDRVEKACVVTPLTATSEDQGGTGECTRTMTVDPTQTVELTFFRSEGDPCGWIRTASGWQQTCW